VEQGDAAVDGRQRQDDQRFERPAGGPRQAQHVHADQAGQHHDERLHPNDAGDVPHVGQGAQPFGQEDEQKRAGQQPGGKTRRLSARHRQRSVTSLQSSNRSAPFAPSLPAAVSSTRPVPFLPPPAVRNVRPDRQTAVRPPPAAADSPAGSRGAFTGRANATPTPASSSRSAARRSVSPSRPSGAASTRTGPADASRIAASAKETSSRPVARRKTDPPRGTGFVPPLHPRSIIASRSANTARPHSARDHSPSPSIRTASRTRPVPALPSIKRKKAAAAPSARSNWDGSRPWSTSNRTASGGSSSGAFTSRRPARIVGRQAIRRSGSPAAYGRTPPA